MVPYRRLPDGHGRALSLMLEKRMLLQAHATVCTNARAKMNTITIGIIASAAVGIVVGQANLTT